MLTNKKLIFISIILLPFVLFSGCSNKSDGYYDVYGTITTQEFNSPIAGAEVTISGKSATTNSKGKYSISNVKSGNYIWEVSSSNYQDFSKKVNVDGNSQIDEQLALITGSASVSGNITLYNYTGYTSTSSITTKNSTISLNTSENNKKYKKGEVIVKYKEYLSTQSIQNVQSKQNLQRMNSLNSSKGKMIKYKIPNNKNVEEVVEYYNNLEDVEWAEPNYIAYTLAIPSDANYDEQWGFINLNMEAAWDERRNSDSVTVAVLDTGIIPDHPDLENNLSNEGADFVGGEQTNDPSNYNVTDYDPTDETTYENGGSHGTHVSGIIGAVSNNELGVAGTNWSTDILPIRVLDASGGGSHWDIAEGMYYSVDKGAEVINMSFGGDGSNLLHTAIQDAYNSDVVLVAAAGNSGSNRVIYPAAYDETIAVGATDRNNALTNYSNYGSNLDLVAPGGADTYSIYSTWGYYDGSSTVSGYAYMQGTSMATPYVSGVAALLLADGVTPRDIRKRLTSTAVDLGPAGRDDYYGYGLVDGYGALLGKKLKNPYAFAAHKENGDIYVKSEMTRVNDNGFYSLNEVVAEEVCIVGWRDVNENQTIDAGDYYGEHSSTINISEDSLHTASFNMYYITDSSSTNMEVKGLPKVEKK